jgi:hypothetical protein
MLRREVRSDASLQAANGLRIERDQGIAGARVRYMVRAFSHCLMTSRNQGRAFAARRVV